MQNTSATEVEIQVGNTRLRLEHDISVLKYKKEQLEKCFSLEMQKLKLKFDHDKLETGNRFKNEKDLKRVLKGQYERKLSGDKLRLEWLY